MVHLFNLTHSGLTYASKLFCVFCAVVSLFVGIHSFGQDHFLSVFGILVGEYTVLAYMALYGDAFEIPLEVERVKKALIQKLRLSMVNDRKETETKIIQVELESLSEADDDEVAGMDSKSLGRETAALKLSNGAHEALLKVVQSVPPLGIKAGEFQVVTRESTTDYLGFVTQQVSSLLIAFQ